STYTRSRAGAPCGGGCQPGPGVGRGPPRGGPMGPVRNLIFRLWTGAQGTLGIMTKMCVQILPFIEDRKIFFITFTDLKEAIEPIKKIQRKEIGMESFLLNSFNLAALLSNEWDVPELFPVNPRPSETFEQLRTSLPPWVLAVCIRGGPRRPEEKIAFEGKALREVCQNLNLELKEDLPPVSGLDQILMHEILYPWGILKKFHYRGSVHTLHFKSPLMDIVKMDSVITKICEEEGYDRASVGSYFLPLERGRAVHCEFDLHCDLQDADETERVKNLYFKVSEALMNQGACFDRAYGAWADMVYRSSGSYTEKLREIKVEMDPHGIMNPGKLCFG
ncbi:MAG: hypothetical protein QGG48_12800, partial [Desulfatiglandales bacterium]|nr:hypothetical protein [Desulfatiglandales bacterium]